MKNLFSGFISWTGALFKRLGSLYHPRTIRERGWLWGIGLALLTAVIFLYGVGVYWTREPAPLNVRQVALDSAGGEQKKIVPGYTSTATLIAMGETLLNKPGGYLSNDQLPPSNFFGMYKMLDNTPNWEFGALTLIRDVALVLRNDFSRSQSQSVEDKDLAVAHPRFNFSNDSWLFPPSEREYAKGIEHLRGYLTRLADPADQDTQFFTRADNLNDLLAVVSKRLGSLSQRLNASVSELRENTDLAGDSEAEQATRATGLVEVETPWLEIDDIFYESRGYVWGLLNILRAAELDFDKVLKKKNAVASLRQVIRLLEQALDEPSSPVVLNGDPMGWMANYSKSMVSYVSPANAAIIDLRHLLTQG